MLFIHAAHKHHTQKHTKSPPPILLHLPKFQLGCLLNCHPHHITRVTRRSKKHTVAFDCQQKLLSSFVIQKPSSARNRSTQPTFYKLFCLLYATRTNLQCETFRNASCFSTFCTHIITCVNQTGQDLT